MTRQHFFNLLSTLSLVLLLALFVDKSYVASASVGSKIDTQSVGTAFTYQGRLTDGGSTANGPHDFQFILYDAPIGGNQVGPIVTKENLPVNNGLFTVTLDFGAVFNETALYLDVGVRPGNSTRSYTVMSPRQTLTSVPYAIYAQSVKLGETWKNEGILGWILRLENTTVNGGEALQAIAEDGTAISAYSNGIGKHALQAISERGTAIIARSRGQHTSGIFVSLENSNSSAIHAEANNGTGLLAFTDGEGQSGVVGYARGRTGLNYGVEGVTLSPNGYAGYFQGRVYVIGNLTKGGGGFKIDHPLDPANKYLYHSFVESPDMKNIYDGVVTLNASGEAVVEMPIWFEALNIDFRYQLTPIGASSPNLYVAEEIRNNRFKIAGGTPNLKVSWQVTGIRHDAYAQTHRIPVEEDKPTQERGTYLYPLEAGQSQTSGLDYIRQQSTLIEAQNDAE